MSKKLFIAIMVLLFLVMAVSGFLLVREILQSNKEIEDFENLADLIEIETDSNDESYYVPEKKPSIENSGTSNTDESATDESAPEEVKIIRKRNLAPLFERNPDGIGWIYIHNTSVNYPVMHTPENPQKYIHKDINGDYSYSGIPFLQGDCTLESDNLLIYAHNMQNGTMFAAVKDYREKDFFAEHPVFEFETEYGLKYFEVFAVVRLKNTDSWYSFINAADEKDFNKKIEYIKKKSLYDIDITPEYGQQLVTLSTCYGGDDSDRIIIVGAEILV